jgi:hypothetical protein
MQDTSSVHERCWDDIPWWVNGTLPEAEQRRVAAHVEHCSECREELARQRQLYAHMHADAASEPVPLQAWDKLLARIDAEQPSSGKPATAKAQWLQIVLWAQAAVIAGLAVLLWLPAGTGSYVTLTSSSSSTPHGAVRVVFAPDASLERINRLLHQIGGEVVAGPSEAGVYTVKIASADAAPTIAALRRHREVLFAEPASATSHR